MSLALVLGAGGVTGVAWETGLLKGLGDAGVDLTGADLIVGTSAGSVVGAQVATGINLDDLYEALVSSPRPEPAPDLSQLARIMAARPGDNATAAGPRRPEMLAWIGAQARAATTRFTEAGRLEMIRSRLPIREWPERRLLITAVDTSDGSFRAWDRESGVPLPVAVAASCAVPWVYPPVMIAGRRYMDGGVRSGTNADLAAGHDRVIVVAPIAMSLFGGPAPLDGEVAGLRAAGAHVEVVAADAEAEAAMGPNPLDPARRPAAARAGLAQAERAAASLRGVLVR